MKPLAPLETLVTRPLKMKRALLSVSDKTGIEPLARALQDAGVELVATGRTAKQLSDAGLKVREIESISGNPEAFQGRMKTLSFAVCGGILFRRGDASDESDAERLGILPIDCVVVNFYPFKKTLETPGISLSELIEQVDIGGPTLVRAAAKNFQHVLILTDASQYSKTIGYLKSEGAIPGAWLAQCAQASWRTVLDYDAAIAGALSPSGKKLRYGENPHQSAWAEIDPQSPIAWEKADLSYNNTLDLASAYAVMGDLLAQNPSSRVAVIVKHNNPCGVGLVHADPGGNPESAQLLALEKAWQGDPVSAFGGVILLSHPLEAAAEKFLEGKFIEVLAAPGLSEELQIFQKKKNLKAVAIRKWGVRVPMEKLELPGVRLEQEPDSWKPETLDSPTQKRWPPERDALAFFGVAIAKALKSNAITLVRSWEEKGQRGFQLVGAGQGQPNRVDALRRLAIPRAQAVTSRADLSDCLLVSDAFFPFRDAIDEAARVGIRFIVQPGGSKRDEEVITACNEHGIALGMSGTRHFKH